MAKSSVPQLQDKVFRSLGIDNAAPGGKAGRHSAATRKDQRKANRVQKKSNLYSKTSHRGNASDSTGVLGKGPAKRNPSSVRQDSDGVKLSKGDSHRFEASEALDSDDASSDASMGLGAEEASDEDTPETPTEAASSSRKLSRSERERIAQDDAAIRDFERKLGIKKGRKSLPQAFKDDGLDELMGDLSSDSASDGLKEDTEDRKRKQEYDDWLASKRRKTGYQAGPSSRTEHEADSGEDSEEGFEEFDDQGFVDSDDEDSGDGDLQDLSGAEDDSFDGFESEEQREGQEQEEKPRIKENPYIAPTSGAVVAKYVPPSLRRAAGTERDTQNRLRKQVQGLVNRLTDANILSIVKGVEQLYQQNARGDVTEALTDVILVQVCKPEALPDQFFVLNGGFSAAIYKIIGSSFGTHLVRRVVKEFGDEYEKARAVQNDESAIPKEPSNLLTFLSQLYVFEVVRCKIIFDYMERLLEDLTELNVELLLRICRNGGRLLRRDDPQNLKKVANALRKSVATTSHADVSVRTRFMVETIDDLKNRKTKGKGLDSSVVSEHVVKMKKQLGELKSQSRRFEGATPMGIDLDDILHIDTRGKWWLVGASVPQEGIKGKGKDSKDALASHSFDSNPSYDTSVKPDDDEEDMDFVLPDYPKKARSQGLTLPSQIAIFSALMTGMNSESGWRQINNLGLKKDDKREVAKVLVQCVGSEAEYNPYYAGVAHLACGDGKLRFAFQARLWQIFRAMGESLFGEEADDADSSDTLRFQDEQRIQKVAQFYASLIAEGSLSIAVLKPLSIPELEPCTQTFVEALFVGLLQECKSKKPAKEDARVLKAFRGARDVPKLATNIEWFLREKLRKNKRLGAKKLRKLEEVRAKALAGLQQDFGLED